MGSFQPTCFAFEFACAKTNPRNWVEQSQSQGVRSSGTSCRHGHGHPPGHGHNVADAWQLGEVLGPWLPARLGAIGFQHCWAMLGPSTRVWSRQGCEQVLTAATTVRLKRKVREPQGAIGKGAVARCIAFLGFSSNILQGFRRRLGVVYLSGSFALG